MTIGEFKKAIDIYPDDLQMVIVLDNCTNSAPFKVESVACSEEPHWCELHANIEIEYCRSFNSRKAGGHNE